MTKLEPFAVRVASRAEAERIAAEKGVMSFRYAHTVQDLLRWAREDYPYDVLFVNDQISPWSIKTIHSWEIRNATA